MADQRLVLAGMGLILLGFLVTLIGALSGSEGDVKVGVGGFIGPVPFGFANDPRMLAAVLFLSAAILLLFFLQ